MTTARIAALLLFSQGALAGLAAAADGYGSVAPSRLPTAPLTGYIEPGSSWLFQRRNEFPDGNGTVGVAYDGEPFDTATHPFFRPGPNGRACVTCHQPANGMSLNTETIRARWQATGGKDPLFDMSDGANCPNLPPADPKSHSLLLEHGLFRIALPWPPRRPDGRPVESEIAIEVVADPTGCNTSRDYGLKSRQPAVSVFRRVRMTANVRYIEVSRVPYNAKDWTPLDRDPITKVPSSMLIMSDSRTTSLAGQARDAAVNHMNWHEIPPADLERILDFQRRLYVAQQSSTGAGRFDIAGTPKALGMQAMVDGKWGVNGNDIDTGVFHHFDEWKGPAPGSDATAEFRASVARGYDVFFIKPFWIRDTFGINHFVQFPNPYKQTCAFCHNLQMVGVDNLPGFMDLGVSNLPHAGQQKHLPLFKVTCKASVKPHPFLGREIYTHDPGRALISGKCSDVGALTMQQMRGLSARAPYFGNGRAKSLRELVDFYDRRFSINYTDQEKQDLINFLSVL